MEERDQKFEKFKVYRNKRKTVIAADTVQYYRVRKFFNVWICRKCCQEYSTPEDVTKHLRKHRSIKGHERQLNGLTQGNVCGNFAWTIDAERNVFTCTVCSTEFQDKFLFHEHFKESHHELFLCHQCNEKFSTSVSYLRHMRNHSNCVRIIVNGGVYNEICVCHICLEEFRNQKSFENHVREHPVCVVCSEKFVSYNNLLVHQLRSHTAHVDEETVEQSNVLDQISDTDKLNGNGNVYGGASENLACILNDDYSETDHDDSQIEDSGQKETALKRFSCSICRERFTTKLLCMEHISTHLTCVVCSKAFKNLPTLRIHQENTHTVDFKYFGPYIFLCDICGMNFRKYNSFEGHRLGHAGIKPYVCQYCSRGFSNRRPLLVHLKKHTGDKPFCCEHCGERFDRHTSFSNHVKRHTGERPFTCQVCDKGFITKQARNSHQVICTNRVVEEGTESESDSSD